MFDTHCHLNFSRFKKNVDEVIIKAKDAGITTIVIPGTDIPTSAKAVEISDQHENIYAAAGIHPHHVYELKPQHYSASFNLDQILEDLERVAVHPKVVAIGEVGMDRHVYENTKYKEYNIDEAFIDLQKELLTSQILLAIRLEKSLILHNREAKADLLPLIDKAWNSNLEGKTVFHCCEPDVDLLEYAKNHKIYIGVDGDITYYREKQEFIKKVPLEMLVLETDSPFLLPEPLRSQKLFPNKPENLSVIAEFIASLKGITKEELGKVTYDNAKKLFQIS